MKDPGWLIRGLTNGHTNQVFARIRQNIFLMETFCLDVRIRFPTGGWIYVIVRLSRPNGVFVELDLLVLDPAINHGREFAVPNRERFMLPRDRVSRHAGSAVPENERSGIG